MQYLQSLLEYIWEFLLDPPGWLTALGTLLTMLGIINQVLKIVRTGPSFWIATALLVLAGLGISAKSPLWLLHPTGRFDTVPEHTVSETGSLRDIGGSVRGLLDPAAKKVVIYTRTDHWYVQPFAEQPLTNITDRGTWQAQTHPGAEYAALVVKPEYKPAAQVDALPATGGDVLVVIREEK